MPAEKKIWDARWGLRADGSRFQCAYLGADVKLTDEREQHIAENHPDLLPEYHDRIAPTLADPDEVRLSTRFSSAHLFTRWYNDLLGGKHVVVVVVTEAEPDIRHWIITAYITRRLARGEVEWRRS